MGAPSLFQGWEPTYSVPTKAELLRELALMAHHAASTPTEALMAGILCDLFASEMSESAPLGSYIVWAS